MIRRSLSLVALMIVAQFAFVLSPVMQQTVAAASQSPQDQLERWLFYRGMRACLEDPYFGTGLTDGNDNEMISAGDVNAGKLQIRDKKEGFGYLGPGLDGGDDNDGTVKCETPAIFSQGAAKLGFSSVVSLICEMNRALSGGDNDRIKPSNAADCEKSESFEFNGGGGDVFQRALTTALEKGGSKDRPPFNINDNNGDAYGYKALLYLIGSNSLAAFCGGGVSLEEGAADGGDINNSDVVSVDVVKSDGTVSPSQPYALGNTDRDENSKVDDVYYNQGGNANEAQDLRCDEMAKMTRDNSAAYAAWKVKNQDVDPGNKEDGEVTYETTCAIDGVGWIVCPVMIFVGKMNDAAFGFLEEILGIRPAVVTSESTQAAWAAFRDIANVAFVIAFMVIVYSQITSAGISNYGIKKMLPRIVVAAILVNMSFIICAIAVDLSNIVGASVYSLFQNSIAANIGSDIANGGWERFIVGALATATAVGVILVVVALFVSPMALLALGLIILILIARQALVILLIVVAPLAFVAYLLPNTEDWFKKWYKAFIAVLMVYPIVGAVFGVSTLASRVLSSVAADTEDSSLLQIIALGVLAVPLFAVPAILKSSLSAAGSIGTRLSGYADKAQSRATKAGGARAKSAYDNTAFARGRALSKTGKKKYRDESFAGAVTDPQSRWQRLRGVAARGYGASAVGSRMPVIGKGQEAAAQYLENAAYGSAANADNEEVGFATRRMTQAAYKNQEPYTVSEGVGAARTTRQVTGTQAHLKRELDTALASGDSVRTRAAFDALRSTGEGGLEEARRSILNSEEQGHFYNPDGTANALKSDLQAHVGANAGSIKPKDVRLDTWKNGGDRASQITQLRQANVGGLDDEKIATQSASSLRSSNITAAQARRVLDNDSVAGEIKQRQIEILEHIAAGGTPSTAP